MISILLPCELHLATDRRRISLFACYSFQSQNKDSRLATRKAREKPAWQQVYVSTTENLLWILEILSENLKDNLSVTSIPINNYQFH